MSAEVTIPVESREALLRRAVQCERRSRGLLVVGCPSLAFVRKYFGIKARSWRGAAREFRARAAGLE